MARRRYVVAYDICDQRRLRRVYKTMTAFGYALQYSVFVCDLDRGEKSRLRVALAEIVHHGRDSIVFMDLGAAETRGEEWFEFIGERRVLPSRGARVV
jgi:CRISPR-associated protein Cas2